jgi:hypothetical protein
MFTIAVKKIKGDGFIATVKEIPLLGQLQADDPQLLANQVKKEIRFLVKGRPDLERAKIEVVYDE